MWVHTKVGEAIKTEQQESENEGNAEPGLNPKPHVWLFPMFGICSQAGVCGACERNKI